MSIFGKIKDAVFGQHGPLGGQFSGRKDAPAAQPGTAAPHPQTTAAEPTGSAPAMPQMGTPAAPATAQPVDVAAVLESKAAAHGGNLNWKSSIVDLMKVLDLDSSLANRKELATELGYSGAKDGSAEMNIWLHRAVMKELARNGGTVPASLAD